ncbi:hypothetical protein HYT84_02690 [Candidatus Micrarchaeota archaeon]|nr:hypothetical protein [Candidatus Micrarchaeota archaeon]
MTSHSIEFAVTKEMCSNTFTFLPSTFLELSVYAFMASVALLAFFYLMGILFRNSNFTSFIKLEIFELFVTGAIIVAIMLITSSMCTMKVGWFFPQSDGKDLTIWERTVDYFVAARNFIIGWISAAFLVGSAFDQMAATTIYSKPFGMGVVTSPLAGLGGPLKQILYQVINALSIAMVTVQAQLYVLLFMFYGYTKYYIPIGIILRSFTPTRRFGGAIIAIGLGFLFLFPALMVVAYEIVGDIIATTDSNMWDSFNSHIAPALKDVQDLDSYNEKIQDVLSDKSTPATNPNKIELPEYNPSFLQSTYDLFKAGGTIPGKVLYVALLIPTEALAMAFLAGFLIPAVNIIILAQAIKSLSRNLGEEVDITILTRLI